MDMVVLEGTVLGSNGAAALIRFVDATGREIEKWFPRSQICDKERNGDQVKCTIPQWVAKSRGVV